MRSRVLPNPKFGSMTFEKLFLKTDEKDVLYLLMDGLKRSEIAVHMGIRHDSVNKKIMELKRKLNTSNLPETLVKAICLDNELKEQAELKAEATLEKLGGTISLNVLEKTFLIETLNGKKVIEIAKDLNCDTLELSLIRHRLRRRLAIRNDAEFVLRAIATGLLQFELNSIPVQAIRNDDGALWEYFQEYLRSKKDTNYLYAPVFSHKIKALIDISPEYIQIVQLRVLGYSNLEIANMTGCTRQTISRKVTEIKRKYKQRTALELVLWAVNNELIKLQGELTKDSVPARSQMILEKIQNGKRVTEIASEMNVKPASINGSLAYLKKKWEVKTLEAVLFQWLLRTQPEIFKK